MLELNRRSLILGLGTATIGGTLAGAALARPRQKFFERIGKPLGLQIYTLGPEAGKDIDATFAAVARIGYREIELPNLMGKQPAEVSAAAARAGLAIRSIHVPLVRTGGQGGLNFGSAPAEIADTLGALGASWAVAPILLLPANFRPAAGENFGQAIARSASAAGENLWKESADLLNRKAEALRPLGIKVGYHNHNIEFAPAGNSTGWDILFRETQPGLVHFEVDLGWVAAAGLDPVRFLDRARGRVKLLHVKDMAAGTVPNFRIEMKPAEVGSGILPWQRILPAAQRAGVEHYLVEQEPPFTIPRIESAGRSHDYLAQVRA